MGKKRANQPGYVKGVDSLGRTVWRSTSTSSAQKKDSLKEDKTFPNAEGLCKVDAMMKNLNKVEHEVNISLVELASGVYHDDTHADDEPNNCDLYHMDMYQKFKEIGDKQEDFMDNIFPHYEITSLDIDRYEFLDNIAEMGFFESYNWDFNNVNEIFEVGYVTMSESLKNGVREYINSAHDVDYQASRDSFISMMMDNHRKLRLYPKDKDGFPTRKFVESKCGNDPEMIQALENENVLPTGKNKPSDCAQKSLAYFMTVHETGFKPHVDYPMRQWGLMMY